MFNGNGAFDFESLTSVNCVSVPKNYVFEFKNL